MRSTSMQNCISSAHHTALYNEDEPSRTLASFLPHDLSAAFFFICKPPRLDLKKVVRRFVMRITDCLRAPPVVKRQMKGGTADKS